jgi:hypothetical protein
MSGRRRLSADGRALGNDGRGTRNNRAIVIIRVIVPIIVIDSRDKAH